MNWLVACVVGLGLLVSGCGGSDSETSESPSPTATDAATATREPGDTATPGATLSPTSWDDYVDIVEGGPVPLPEGVVIYYYGYVFTEGIPADRWLRAHQTEDGLVIRDLSEGLPEGSNGYSFVGAPATGHLATIICVQGHCGGHGDPSSDAREERFESFDGGITWERSIGIELPDDTYLAGTRSDGVTIAFRYDASDNSYEWFTWPAREPVMPPEPTALARMVEGRFVWRTYEEGASDGGSFYDEHGAVIAAPVQSPLEARHNFYRENLTDVVWWIPDDRQTELIGYVSEVAADGALVRSVRYEGNDMWPIAWLDEDRVVVLRFYTREGSIGAAYIVNLETGEMNEIDDLRPTDKDRDSYVTAVMTGEFAMVEAPGSCLHVRAAADVASESLECFADGVLFEVTAEAVIGSGGAEWLPVRAPGGIEGYASGEFLVR